MFKLTFKNHQNCGLEAKYKLKSILNNPFGFLIAFCYCWSRVFRVNKLVKEYNTNSTCKRLLDELDWYYLPVVNPDGYEHTHASSSVS